MQRHGQLRLSSCIQLRRHRCGQRSSSGAGTSTWALIILAQGSVPQWRHCTPKAAGRPRAAPVGIRRSVARCNLVRPRAASAASRQAFCHSHRACTAVVWRAASCCQRGRVDAVWRSHSNCCGSSGALANRGQRARGVARLSMSRIIDVCTLAAHHSTTSNDRLAASRRMLERPLCPRGCGVRYGVLHRTRPRGAQRCALCRTGSSPVGAHT